VEKSRFGWVLFDRYNRAMPNELEDPRTYFAAERTFLAWIRTGLGLMGVGFALARFGLFLREFQASQQTTPHRSGLSVDSGIVLVALGIVVNVSAVVGHIRTVREMQSGAWNPGISRNAVILALLLAVFGVGVAIYLLLLR
jgi:putative membrane protein